MGGFSARGSNVISRIINGDTLYFYLELGDNPLYQSVDPDNPSNVFPNWETNADSQPTVKPVCSSAMNGELTLTEHKWYYNGSLIIFGTAVDGWATEQTLGRFKYKVSDGTIKIVKNLASADNVSNDTLKYEGVADLDGINYNQSKTIDILIQRSSASAFTGFIFAKPAQLSAEVTSTTLTTKMSNGSSYIDNYTCKWYKNGVYMTGKDGKNLSVSRDDIDSEELFLAKFYQVDNGVTAGSPCATAAIKIADTGDIYRIIYSISGALGKTGNVKATPSVINIRTTAAVDLSTYTCTWNHILWNHDYTKQLHTFDTEVAVIDASYFEDKKDGHIEGSVTCTENAATASETETSKG